MTRAHALAAVIAGALALVAAAPAGAATVKVTAADGVDWFTGDARATGTGTFVAGPATPPLGTGSFELRTPDSAAKVQLLTDRYDGTPLADIDGLGYATYRSGDSTGFIAGVAALNLRVDLDGDGTADAYAVYEPYQDQGNGAIQTGVWQTWDAFRDGEATWWISNGAGGCGQGPTCTWAHIVETFPDATIREGASCGTAAAPKSPCPGSLGVNQGSGNPGIVSSVDALTVSVAGASTTYDFDAPVGPPTSKDECKDGGWQTFDLPRAFKNQGDCVSFVARGR